MLTLLRQEAYKAFKGKAIYISLILLLIYQGLIAFGTKQYHIISPNEFITTAGNAEQIVEIIMVVIASTIITNEFVNKTIKNLLCRQYSRLQVFLSKFITLVWMYVLIVVVNYLFTLIFKVLLFRSTQVTSQMIHATANNGIGQTLYVFLITAFVILISNIAKSSGGAIGIGVATILASQVLATVLSLLINKMNLVKFNPFNFFLVSSQYGSDAVKSVTHLSLNAMTIGALIYGVIFYAIAYMIFNHRNI
ncbi:ABC transporter permease [Nicoliella lavandulae]|uniref:ABC transporter permease n=1 Tax=Nicoliella lavandulae TaxID=3082954 RepID=A0ABU8SIU7_9LACO